MTWAQQKYGKKSAWVLEYVPDGVCVYKSNQTK